MKVIHKILAVLALAAAPQAFAADVEDADLTTSQTATTGAELTIACVGSLTGLADRDVPDRSTLAYDNTAGGNPGAGRPGAFYTVDDPFSVNASCHVTLSIGCAAGFGSAGDCDMVRLAAGVPMPTPLDSQKIEALDIQFVKGIAASAAYAPLDLGANGSTDVTDTALRYTAQLGASSSDNAAGTYRVDVDISIIEDL